MLFNSIDFFVFLIGFFVLWPFLRRRNHLRYGYLIAASFVFYGWWDWRFIFLVIACGLNVYLAGLAIYHFPRWKKLSLVLSLVGNLGILGVFKYLDFCIGNIVWLLRLFNIEFSIQPTHIILPIGISFYTFQALTYTFDVYQGKLKPTHNLLHLFSYVSMFPQLLAGPIVRASDMLPQLKENRPITEKQRWEGLQLVVHGFFKKVVIADNLAEVVNMAYGGSGLNDSSLFWWIITIMYTFQIYCDFSGYSDIARGIGKWMGYEYPLNFNHPYISTSFREFWKRWHISLSSWFLDYVYIPLGGSRKGQGRAHANMWITMLISGLWHGAAWTFIIWAALHSFYLSLERITKWPRRIGQLPGGRHVAVLLVFMLTTIAWIFFRAGSFKQAMDILLLMFSFKNMSLSAVRSVIDLRFMLFLFIIIAREMYFYLGLDASKLTMSKVSLLAQPAVVSIMVAACIFMRGPGEAFIYFQF